MAIFTVDATGVHAPSLEDALIDVRQQLAEIFGDDLAGADQTPQGQLAGVIAILEAVVGEALVRLGAATDPDNAVGTQLERLYSLIGIMRQMATRSQVTATVTGVAGTGLPAGSRAKTTAGAEFRTIAAVAIAPSPGVTVEMESVEVGAITADAGTLTQIVTVVPGWETITNAAAAILGQVRQDDPAYRAAGEVRTAHRAVGSIAAMEAGLSEALATKSRVEENDDDIGTVIQEWYLKPHAVLALAQGGTNNDVRRAVESYRGMGVPTMVGIVGGTADETALNAISNGSLAFGGSTYSGIDLSGGMTPAQKAATLTTALAGSGITMRAIDGLYVAMFGWQPSRSPNFNDTALTQALGLDPDNQASYPSGPFQRPRGRPLTVTLTVAQQTDFPADGLNLIRAAATNVVNGYGMGASVWLNDILAAAENVGGTRVTASSVQYNGADISGVIPPLDVVYSLPSANLTITVT